MRDKVIKWRWRVLLIAGFMAALTLATAAHPVRTNEDVIRIKNGEMTLDPTWESRDDVQQLIRLGDGWSVFQNRSRGYQFEVPSSMQPDMTLSEVVAVLEDETLRLEVYVDDFRGTVHSADAYIYYSQGFLRNQEDHQELNRETFTVDGLRVELLEWQRTPLEAIDKDRPYYAKAVLVKDSHRVVTLLFKAEKPLTEEYRRIIESVQMTERTTTPGFHVNSQVVEQTWNEVTERFYQHYFVDNQQLIWGIFQPTAPKTMTDLHQLEDRLDYQFRFLLLYKNLERGFPHEEMENARENDRHVVLTLQTKHRDDQLNKRSLYPLLEGEYDAHLQEYADALKAYGDPVLFRLNNEMNGDWCTYSAYYTAMDTEIFRESWRYVHRFFQEADVDNVIWVWNPHDLSFPGFAWNHTIMYYPGDAYVDIIGLTGYNPGTWFPGEHWRYFLEIYPSLYREYANLFAQPFMIPEFGSSSFGGDKVAWIEDMFRYMPGYDRIQVAIWWNGIDWDDEGNPGRIYRLDETPETLDAFRRGLIPFETPSLPPEEQEYIAETEE